MADIHPDSSLPVADPEVRLAELERPIRWAHLYGNAQPVHLEIGSGSGHWIAEFARLHPEWNLFGIEKMKREVRRAKDKALRRGLTNVRLLCCYADYVTPVYIETGSLEAVHIYFPDPWPKTRHHKRRVVRPQTATEFARILRPGGRIFTKTDIGDYHRLILETLGAEASLRRIEERRLDLELPRDEMGVPLPVAELRGMNLPECLMLSTNYERKALEAGRPVYYSAWEKLQED